MAQYNSTIGVWIDKYGQYFDNQADAEASEADPNASNSSGDFNNDNVLGAQNPFTGSATPTSADKSNELFSQGYTDLNHDGKIDNRDVALSKLPYGTPDYEGGTATQFQTTKNPDGTLANNPGDVSPGAHQVVPGDVVDIIRGKGKRPDVSVVAETPADYQKYWDGLGTVTDNGIINGVQNISYNAPAVGGPGADRAADKAGVDAAVEQTGNDYTQKVAENEEENKNLWANAYDNYNDIVNDTSLSDESRRTQLEGQQLQRDLLEKLYNFDPAQYATKFSDQALARQVALSRSGGTPAQQQAQMFAAMEQAPSLYAEGQKQADALQNQRLTQAENVVQNFGQLGTATRSQDENRSQFEATLQTSIADSVAKLTANNVQLNDAEAKAFGDIWTNFAQLQSVYDKMSSDEQVAWWHDQTARYGVDKQFEAVLDQLRAGGAISSKDIIGGLFQLGGSAIGAGGLIAAAGVKK